MRAHWFDDFKSLDDLRLYEEDEPQPQRGELLVRVHAVSLNHRDVEDVARIFATTKIRPVIDRIFDFEDAKEAFAYLEEPHRFGKIVIKYRRG